MEEFNIPHKDYIDSLSGQDVLVALQFMQANPDCPLDTIKHAVSLHAST